jgi:hypothetical protein
MLRSLKCHSVVKQSSMCSRADCVMESTPYLMVPMLVVAWHRRPGLESTCDQPKIQSGVLLSLDLPQWQCTGKTCKSEDASAVGAPAFLKPHYGNMTKA